MQAIRKITPLLKSYGLGLATLAALSLTAHPARAQDVINFDNLPNEPATNNYKALSSANNGSNTLDAVTFTSNAYIAGDQYGGGFAKPSSGGYALFNSGGGNGIGLTTTKTLYSLEVGQTGANNGNNATEFTVQALDGSTVLGSVSTPLTSSTLKSLDTSSFANLTGITGYNFVPANPSNDVYFFIADDLRFSPLAVAPEPSSVATVGIIALFVSGLMLKARTRKASGTLAA